MFTPYSPYFMGQQMGQQAPFMPPMSQTMQQQVQPAQAQQSGPDWIQAPTIKHVEQVQVQPGGKAWIMVQNEPIFALKVADNLGMVSTDYYRFEKFNPSETAPEQQFVTRAEFQQFIESMTAPKTTASRKESAEK